MKLKLVSSMILLSGLLIASCGTTSEQKVENAKDASEEANEAYVEEMENYKAEKLMIIKANEETIAKMKLENEEGFSDEYQDWINSLEEKNEALKIKLKEYDDQNESNWESFKKEFGHDMDELGQAFKNVFKNGK